MDLPGEIRLRRFRSSDSAPLRRLIEETVETSYAEVYPPRAVAFFKTFHEEQRILERSQAGTTLVAERNGEIIATASLVRGEILAVFVHPDSQHGGCGKALMRVLEDEAIESGLEETALSVSLPSKRFYESLGYELVEACSKDVGQGQRLDFWKARKCLAPNDP